MYTFVRVVLGRVESYETNRGSCSATHCNVVYPHCCYIMYCALVGWSVSPDQNCQHDTNVEVVGSKQHEAIVGKQ